MAVVYPDSSSLAVREAPLTPLRFGAVGDGFTNDDAAFAAMWAALPTVGGHVYLPSNYNFTLTQPLPTHSGLHVSGGDRTRAQITNLISSVFTTTSNQSDLHFHDFSITAGRTDGSTGGHIFDFTGPAYSGPALSSWHHMKMFQRHPGKSVFYGQPCQYLDNQVQQCWILGNARTAPMIDLASDTGSLGDNLWSDLRIDDVNTPTTWAIQLDENSGTSALGNTLQRINFENPAGGAILLRGQNGADLDQIWLWDMHTTPTNHLIEFRKRVGQQANVGCTLRKIARPGGAALGSGLDDVYGSIGTALGTHIYDCVTDGSQALRIDMAFNPGTIIERCYGSGVGVLNYIFGTVLGAAAGTGAVVSTKAGTLYDGNVVMNTGTSTTAGTILSCTFPNGLRSTPTAVIIAPMSSQAADALLYAANVTTTGFDIVARNALPASSAGVKFAIDVRTAVNG